MTDVILNARPKVGEVIAGHFITQVEGKKVWGISTPYTPDPETLIRCVAWDKKSIKERNEIRRTDFSASFIPGRCFATISKGVK
jgi:hypothetical protein